jgi:hypothetical protein
MPLCPEHRYINQIDYHLVFIRSAVTAQILSIDRPHLHVIDMHVFFLQVELNFKDSEVLPLANATLLVPGPAGLTFVTCQVASDFSSRNPTFGLPLAP